MRAWVFGLCLAVPLAATGSAALRQPAQTVDTELNRARAEAASADAQARRLEQAAAKALDAAGRLRAQQLAAAQAIEAAEARISAADAEVRLVAAQQAVLRTRLGREQRPAASLLAGLAMMARRPPLVSLADNGSTDELVRVRVLLNATLPVIRARTAGLTHQLGQGARLEEAAVAARTRLKAGRSELDRGRAQFARLERKALEAAGASSGEALDVGDQALAATEMVDRLSSDAIGERAAAGSLSALSAISEPPAGPGSAGAAMGVTPFEYRLPATAAVSVGLGAISSSGVRSRGILLGTARGARLTVPADGIIRFAGPFRNYDGVVIIDHGNDWMSLMVNAAARAAPGDRVRLGDLLGQALGPVDVELSHRGNHVSPALIAGSSARLSKSRG